MAQLRPSVAGGALPRSIGLFTPLGSECYKNKSHPNGMAFVFYGAGDEARTRYLHLGKVALYRMSYTREEHGLL